MVNVITRGTSAGLPSNWLSFLGIKRSDKDARPFYVLDFRTTNRDKEKWQEITNYVRRSTDKNFRLMDNLYDMAKPMASDSHSQLELEPEDVLIIPILTEEEEIEAEITAKSEPSIIAEIKKKRGRPVKESIPV
jgi:hypothetical protein